MDIFFSKWFFPKLSAGGVEYTFVNPAGKFLSNSEVFSAQIPQVMKNRYVFFLYTEIILQNVPLAIENALLEPAENFLPNSSMVLRS